MTTAADSTLRPGTPDDALCLGVLAIQVFLDTYASDGIDTDLAREVLDGYSPERFAERLADPQRRFTLVERAGRLVAFLELALDHPCPVGPDPSPVEVVRLYVQRPAQGTGLGRRLLHDAEAQARAAGANALWLSAWSGNTRALAVYDATGWQRQGMVDHVVPPHTYQNVVFHKVIA